MAMVITVKLVLIVVVVIIKLLLINVIKSIFNYCRCYQIVIDYCYFLSYYKLLLWLLLITVVIVIKLLLITIVII